jgi:hypothetical protein
LLPGLVLYNGEQKFNVRAIRIFNPLHIESEVNPVQSVPGVGYSVEKGEMIAKESGYQLIEQ